MVPPVEVVRGRGCPVLDRLECPRCGGPITDEELRALWGRRNGLKSTDKKRAGAEKAWKARSEKAKARREAKSE